MDEGSANIIVRTSSGKSATCAVTVTKPVCKHLNKTTVNATEPKCITTRNDEYKVCDDCGKVFKADGTGSMSSDNYNYEYKYIIDGNILKIDFARDEVHDVAYSFNLKDGVLKLISKEGTVSIGEEYILKKDNK